MEQLEPVASEVPHVFAPVEIVKSVGLAPTSVMPLMVSEALPVFARIAVSEAEVVPTDVEGKLRVGVSDTAGVEATEKLAVTLCGALMVTVVAARFAPATFPVQLVNA
jgi:hypothetical protein